MPDIEGNKTEARGFLPCGEAEGWEMAESSISLWAGGPRGDHAVIESTHRPWFLHPFHNGNFLLALFSSEKKRGQRNTRREKWWGKLNSRDLSRKKIMDTEGAVPTSPCPIRCQSHGHRRCATASLAGRSKSQPSLASQLSTRINQIKVKTRKEVNWGLGGKRGTRKELCIAWRQPGHEQDYEIVVPGNHSSLHLHWFESPHEAHGQVPSPPAKEQRGQFGQCSHRSWGSRDTTAQNVLSWERSTGSTAPNSCTAGTKVLQGFQLEAKWQDHYPSEGQLLSYGSSWMNTLLLFSFWGCLSEWSLCLQGLSTLLETTRIH